MSLFRFIEKRTKTGELATKVEGKPFREVDGVAESGLLSGAQVKSCGAGSIEGETSLGVISECVRTLWVMRLHGCLAIRGVDIGVRDTSKDVRGPEGRV